MQFLLEGKPHLINLLDFLLACEHRHLPVVSWLLQQRALMVNMSNQEGKTAFFVACEKGFAEIVKAMLLSLSTTQPLLDLNAGTSNHFPLMIACKSGHVEVVKEMLERGGGNVNVNKMIRGSALTNACTSGNLKILELLLNHPKIDVHQKVQGGSTLLHHVCRENQLPQLQRLLRLPTLKLNQQTDVGSTPLKVACQQGKSSSVSELMRYKGVNPYLCDSQQRTALWWAAKKGMTSIFLSILCTPHWVIDTKPKGENYPQPYASYLWEYARDTVKFKENYGVTQSIEHPHSSKSNLFLFISSHQRPEVFVD